MTKKELRIKYKELRRQLSPDAIEEMSLAIANKTLDLPIWDFNCFHIFLPIQSHNEINTEYILHILAGKDKNIVVPKSNLETNEMINYLLTDSTLLETNLYGVPEPVDGIEVPPAKIDVVFIPLLAFDKAGHRVGYGKGFYDRFLSECRPETVKIGLSMFKPEDEITDIWGNDMSMDYCITTTEIYRF